MHTSLHVTFIFETISFRLKKYWFLSKIISYCSLDRLETAPGMWPTLPFQPSPLDSTSRLSPKKKYWTTRLFTMFVCSFFLQFHWNYYGSNVGKSDFRFFFFSGNQIISLRLYSGSLKHFLCIFLMYIFWSRFCTGASPESEQKQEKVGSHHHKKAIWSFIQLSKKILF